MESNEDKLANLLADCIKTMQEIKFICERAKTFNIEKEGIDDILALLKKKV